MQNVTPDQLLQAYAQGIFPMADSARARDIYWVSPEERGIIPLNAFHIPRRLKRRVRSDYFNVRINGQFERVMRECAAPKPDRPSTWINKKILDLYTELHRRGHAHSVETYLGDELVGGLYGVSLGCAFFGESMFSRVTDASKVALVHLVAHLKMKGFTLLDTQFLTDHLGQFGAIEISREDYLVLLSSSCLGAGSLGSEPNSVSGTTALQSTSQTS